MAEYQNMFTRVQVRGPAYAGVPLTSDELDPRSGKPFFIHTFGKLGRRPGRADLPRRVWGRSLICGFIAFEIIGLNMWASVNWSPVQFVRQLPWLALEPPAPGYGLHLPPLAEGGWWLMAGFFLTASILLWWVRVYSPCPLARPGHACRLGVRRGDLALPGARLHPPAPDGKLERGGAVRHLPAPGLDGRVLDPLRQPVLQPVPHALDRVPLRLDAAVRHAWGHGAGDQPVRRRAGTRADRRPRHRVRARCAVLALDDGVLRHAESIHRWAWWFAVLCPLTGGIGILLTGTVVDNWYLWGVKHGLAPAYPAVLGPDRRSGPHSGSYAMTLGLRPIFVMRASAWRCCSASSC